MQMLKLAQIWHSPKLSIISPCTATSAISGRRRTVRFSQSQAEDSVDQGMDHKDKDKETMTHNPNEKTGDVMSHSFGEGYATRSDEEGFGGIYGGNDYNANHQHHKNKIIDESHHEYDRKQGSEVKETENARNQKKGDY